MTQHENKVGYAVGVDLGGTNLRAALVDLGHDGRLVRDVKIPRPQEQSAERMADHVAELVKQVDPEGLRAGVGVGFAGMLRGWTGVVVNAPNFGWREVNLRGPLRERLGPRVELYNDLNAIAYGEAVFGAARGAKDVLCVFVGTGLGAGVVIEGKLYIGMSHLAGEIGHSKVVPGGRLCGCGARGCIEAYVSGVNIRKRAREELQDVKGSLVVELAGGLENVHAGYIDQAARQGDPWSVALWNEVAPLLGTLLANSVALLNPSHIVMGGGVWENTPELRRRVLESFNSLVNGPSAQDLSIVDSTLAQHAGVLGAAALIGAGTVSA
ncbi:MAG TPA: ROK family protein [Polyangia bacterium]|nr:ROK family protein [Polyangia bacterium]